MRHLIALPPLAVLLLAATAARADAPVSLATRGFMERAAQGADALRNNSAASFGSPNYEDNRLFKLRWRLPFLVVGGDGLGPAPTIAGFAPVGGGIASALPAGLALAAEPTQGLAQLIPQVAIGHTKKLGQLQLGVLSTSLGHGTLVDKFTNGPDGAVRKAGVAGEVNLAGVGAQVIVGDFLRPHELFAARVHGRPIMWFTAPDATFQPNELDLDPRTETTGVWVTGVSFVIDADAPVIEEIGFDSAVWGASWDNEAALLDNQLVKAIGHIDLNVLGTGVFRAGVAAHPGLTLMTDVLGTHLEATAAAHVASDNYVPSYFDRLYAVERTKAYGSSRAKAGLDMPASVGYALHAQAGLMQAVTVFADLKDATAFDLSRGGNDATVTAGVSAWLLFVGGNLTLSQTGIHDYLQPNIMGRGFVAMAEGRVGLLFNTVHVVGRLWRMHAPVDAASTTSQEFVPEQGAALGGEMNLDVL